MSWFLFRHVVRCLALFWNIVVTIVWLRWTFYQCDGGTGVTVVLALLFAELAYLAEICSPSPEEVESIRQPDRWNCRNVAVCVFCWTALDLQLTAAAMLTLRTCQAAGDVDWMALATVVVNFVVLTVGYCCHGAGPNRWSALSSATVHVVVVDAVPPAEPSLPV